MKHLSLLLISIFILLAALVVASEDKYDYDDPSSIDWNNAENIQWEKFDSDEIKDIPAQHVKISMLNREQTKGLTTDQIQQNIKKIDSEDVDKLSSSQINDLTESDAENYFEDKLSGGYSPKNKNEFQLLKKITEFSEVDESLLEVDGVKFTEGDVYEHEIVTPQGTISLEAPKKITEENGNYIVGNDVLLKEGDITVNRDDYFLGTKSECELLQNGQPSGVTVSTYSDNGYSIATPRIIPGETDLSGIEEGGVGFDDETLSLKGGDGSFNVVTKNQNTFDNLYVETSESGIGLYNEDKVKLDMDNSVVHNIVNDNPPLHLLPFENQEYKGQDLTMASEDGGRSFEEKKEGGLGAYVTHLWTKVQEWRENSASEAEEFTNDVQAGGTAIGVGRYSDEELVERKEELENERDELEDGEDDSYGKRITILEKEIEERKVMGEWDGS